MSAMTAVPKAETSHSRSMLVASAFAVMWFLLAVLAKYRLRKTTTPLALPLWLRICILTFGFLYALVGCLFVFD